MALARDAVPPRFQLSQSVIEVLDRWGLTLTRENSQTIENETDGQVRGGRCRDRVVPGGGPDRVHQATGECSGGGAEQAADRSVARHAAATALTLPYQSSNCIMWWYNRDNYKEKRSILSWPG